MKRFVVAVVEMGDTWGTPRQMAEMSAEELAGMVKLFPQDFLAEAQFFVTRTPTDRFTAVTAAAWLGEEVTPAADIAPSTPAPEDATEAHKAMAEHFAGKPT